MRNQFDHRHQKIKPMKPFFLPLLLLIVFCTSIQAQEPAPDSRYERKMVMIPMRDGIKLNTLIFIPKNSKEPLPFLLSRTPYGVAESPYPERSNPELAKEGFIFVDQDIRGRYLSEGKFEMLRMTRDPKLPNSIDESSDTYDTIDWLLKNIANNNGKVGVFGISYGGWTSMMALIDPHPALKAISEQATPADWFINDDMHHNGAFRLSYGFDYAFMEEAGKIDTLFPFDTYDNYDWYLRLGPLSNVNEKYFKHTIPSWDNFVNHPNYDDFWKKQSLFTRFANRPLTVPTQHVAGWFDQEDFAGPLFMYELLEKQDKNNLNCIVIGPWNHGGWARSEGRSLGNLQFGAPTSKTFREEIQLGWFNYHLKGKGDGKFAEAVTFQTGSNQWKHYDSWPTKQAIQQALYFHADGKLSFHQPKASTGFDSFISDPANPVPYRTRPIEQTYGPGSRWFTWMTEDQRFVDGRPDVLSWETDVLENDITITGKVIADLFASTSASDADWIVKLIDVYPALDAKNLKMSGYQQIVTADVLRGRFRKSFETPLPVKPNEVVEYKVDLLQSDHTFQKGHKIMVQVQSTWFPVIDRNPQKFVPNIFTAKASDYVKAEHRVYRSGANASKVMVSVVK
jgi:putative CocE/NonD family hydrolase